MQCNAETNLILLRRGQQVIVDLRCKGKELDGSSVAVLDLHRKGRVLPQALEDVIVCPLGRLLALVAQENLDSFLGTPFLDMDVGGLLILA